MKPLLSICIPTYNRAQYLNDLLQCIEKNIKKFPEITDEIELKIFDNNSPDNTTEIVQKYKKKFPFLSYLKRTENIGGDPNIAAAYKENNGKYVWVIGDDDLITEDAIHSILVQIKEKNPNIIIALDVFKNREKTFDSYYKFAKYIYPKNIKYILCHTLISANIIKKDTYDYDYAKKMIPELYGHMYGMFNKMDLFSGKVVVINKCVVVRENRAPFADPTILDKIYFKQKDYMKWISIKLKLNPFFVFTLTFWPTLWNHGKLISNLFRKHKKIRISKKIPTTDCSNLDVFVLTYNRADFLKVMLDSLCTQTAQGFTIKVLDNASTDHTDLVIKEKQKQYPNRKIIHIKNQENIGNANNFLKSQELASNEYTAIFHDDDAIHPEYIKTAMNLFAQYPDAVMVSSWFTPMYNVTNDNWPMMSKNYFLYEKETAGFCAMLLQRWAFPFMIYKTTAYKKFKYQPERYGKIFDFPFLLQVSSLGQSIVMRDSAMRYRQHPGSDTNNMATCPTDEQIFNLLRDETNQIKRCKTYMTYEIIRSFWGWIGIPDLSLSRFLKKAKSEKLITQIQYKIYKNKFIMSLFKKHYQKVQRIYKRRLKH